MYRKPFLPILGFESTPSNAETTLIIGVVIKNPWE